MSRRHCLSLLGASLAGAALPARLEAQAARPPNIVLVVADDLGSTDLGCYGASDLRTPNLDALAARGVRFTSHYVTAPACTPSRASLLTGREHARAVKRYVGMEAEEVTLAELLRSQGYRTGVFGKWHLGAPTEVSPLAQGFDEFLGFKVGAIDNYTHIYHWGANPGHRLWRNDVPYHEDGVYFPDLVTREARSFVRRHRNVPFFLYLPYNLPHYPLQAPKASLAACAHITDDRRRRYAACVHALDHALGLVLETIDAEGLDHDTIVLFLSDHGHSTEPLAQGGGGRATPFRGNKETLLEGGIRVPCIVAWPGRFPSGEVRHQIVSSMDWVPTLAAHAGVSLEGHTIDGRRLDAVIASSRSPSPHAALCWTYGDRWAVREGHWKLMGEGPDTMFLYDLSTDSSESNDLRRERDDVVDRLVDVRNLWAHDLRQDLTVIRELGLDD